MAPKPSSREVTLVMGKARKRVPILWEIAPHSLRTPEILHSIVAQIAPRNILEGFTGAGYGGAKETAMAILPLGKGVRWNAVELGYPDGARRDIRSAKLLFAGKSMANVVVKGGDVFKERTLLNKADLVLFKSVYGYAGEEKESDQAGIARLVSHFMENKTRNAGFLLFEERIGGEGREGSDSSRAVPGIITRAEHLYDAVKEHGNILAVVKNRAKVRLVEYDGKSDMGRWLGKLSPKGDKAVNLLYDIHAIIAADHKLIRRLKAAIQS